MRYGLTVFSFVVLALPISAEQTQKPFKNRWQIVPGLTSANLASSLYLPQSSAGASWSDRRQATVTYWKSSNSLYLIRCIAYFDKDMSQTGEKCEQPTE